MSKQNDHNQTSQGKEASPNKFLFSVRRLFHRSIKKDPSEELREIDKEKQLKSAELTESLVEIERLSARIESVQAKENDATRVVNESSEQEGKAVDPLTRRAFERKRWQFQEDRRNFEKEYWNVLESLRRRSIETHSLRLELLTLESREAEIERTIDRKHTVATVAAVLQSKTQQSTVEVPKSATSQTMLAKKHMLVRDLSALAVRTFRVKPGMTMLTVLGIGVSFATIFFLVSLGYGLEKVLLDQFASDTLMRTLTVQSPNPSAVPLDKIAADRIASFPGIEHVEPIFGLSGQIESDALAAEAELRGADPAYFSVSSGPLKEGRVYESGEHAIILSSNFLQTMNKKSLSEFTKPFTIIAYRPHTAEEGEGVETINLGTDFHVVGISEDDENPNVFLSPEFVSSLVPQYNALSVLTKDDKVVSNLRTSIADLGFMSSSVVDTVDQATKVFNVAEIVLALFGAASLVVATIGMVNTMTVSLLERTQEIGIMKVLGVSDTDVRRLFLLEASIIGGLGGVSGLFLGILASSGVNLLINFLAKNLGGKSTSLFYYPTWFVIAIVSSSLFIGFLTGLMPSQRAAKMDPLNAVKYK